LGTFHAPALGHWSRPVVCACFSRGRERSWHRRARSAPRCANSLLQRNAKDDRGLTEFLTLAISGVLGGGATLAALINKIGWIRVLRRSERTDADANQTKSRRSGFARQQFAAGVKCFCRELSRRVKRARAGGRAAGSGARSCRPEFVRRLSSATSSASVLSTTTPTARTEQFSRLQVDRELKLARLHDWQVGRFLALEECVRHKCRPGE
jgi:hypothetical protein